MRGALARRLGDLDRAEEALQEALAEALRKWPHSGVPDEPAAWLVTTGWHRAVDVLRREQVGRAKLTLLYPPTPPTPPSYNGGDDTLALIFGCCHPALPEPARIALTLRAVCGLTTEEIAAAFLVPTPTMAQRLVRANRLIRDRSVPFRTPAPEELADRLGPVLTVIYLVYNEGYLANSSATEQRRDLATQALALAGQLDLLMPTEPEVGGLAVLLALCEARAASRFDDDGRLVLLSDQDRSRWNQRAIQAAVDKLDRVLARRRPGPYQTHAAIAALHATAESANQTDWAQIRLLYLELFRQTSSPLALLSASVATWRAVGAQRALWEVDQLAARLDGYRLYHATRAELLRELGREAEAAHALQRALALTANPAERVLLTERLTVYSHSAAIG
ncbi:RNA polymerase subunit sigma-24 [Rhizocola hellebori]|uniref:RNA polymerase subunit sigma-24 n=2 Tax=Rhizocola hellebori TaxID=1392758 RepID=A0A8J3VMH7_9ACTN|nr:RNA polymerase subunit sigma-24 [Rhizocola hellebori]